MYISKTDKTTPSVFWTAFILLFSINTVLKSQPCREIVAYYPAWKWYDRHQFVNPKTIKYDRYSVINYAFFKPNPDGTIIGTDDWADENLLKGEIDWTTTPKSYKPNTSLVDLAHQNGVKVVISIGGWTESDNFHSIAADSLKRQTFIADCERLITYYHLDGIDIDWEYPGFEEHKGTSADKQNFTKLISGIRQKLEDISLQTGKKYILTAAFGASESKMAHIEWAKITPMLDAINMMTYDFNGVWNDRVGHNSPLFPPDSTHLEANIDNIMSILMNTYQVPSDKINLGLAFYGHALKIKENTGLQSLLQKEKDSQTFPEGTDFHHIMAEKYRFTEYWDENAKVPYLIGDLGFNTFVSFDNVESIKIKTEYAFTKKLRGVLIWDLTGDYLETVEGIPETPLINIVNLTFCAKTNE